MLTTKSVGEEVAPAETSPAAIQACILFDDNDSVSEAKLLCSRYEFDAGLGPVSTRFHQFDSLTHAVERGAALMDALHAQLLIVATHEGKPLPRAVKFWMGAFVGMKSKGGTTLAAVTSVDPSEHEHAAPVYEYLREIATLEGMPFALFRFSEPRATEKVPVLSESELQAA